MEGPAPPKLTRVMRFAWVVARSTEIVRKAFSIVAGNRMTMEKTSTASRCGRNSSHMASTLFVQRNFPARKSPDQTAQDQVCVSDRRSCTRHNAAVQGCRPCGLRPDAQCAPPVSSLASDPPRPHGMNIKVGTATGTPVILASLVITVNRFRAGLDKSHICGGSTLEGDDARKFGKTGHGGCADHSAGQVQERSCRRFPSKLPPPETNPPEDCMT